MPSRGVIHNSRAGRQLRGNLFIDRETEALREAKQKQDTKVSAQTAGTELLGSLCLSVPVLQKFHDQVRMGVLQGLVELVFAGLVQGPAEQFLHLAWLVGLSPPLVILLFTQHLSIQLVQDRVH
jgi:hypothetical protein